MKNEAMGRIVTFCSYAHEDKQDLIQLEAALTPLREEAIIDAWSDGRISTGDHWDTKIKDALEKAHLILFLITPNLLKSKYVTEHEIPRSIARWEERRCEIVPILVTKPKDEAVWRNHPLARHQATPNKGMWINEYDDKGSAYNVVRFGIREACKKIGGGDNPYRRSDIGDWRHVQRRALLPTGQRAKWEFTEELIEKSDTRAVVLIKTTLFGRLKDVRIEYDLNEALESQAQSIADQTGMDMSAMATMSTRVAADGLQVSEDKLTIGNREYQTRVESLTSQSELDGLMMETQMRAWKSIDVPFDGAVRGEVDIFWSNGATAQQRMTLLDFGVGNAASEKPSPRVRDPLPQEFATAVGAATEPYQSDSDVVMSAPTNESELPSDPFAKLKNTFNQFKAGFQREFSQQFQQQQQPTIFPGHWVFQSNDNLGNVSFDVMLFPNQQLQGACWDNGIQSQLTGVWDFDSYSATFRMSVTSVAYGYPPNNYTATFTITGSDPTAYLAQDGYQRLFRIWMAQ